MSNRFHSKYHRKNHHTYGNLTNADASHDPIASPEQPFLGDFSLQGTLCAVAPASAYAGYFYSNNTALCAFGGNVGIYSYSPTLGIASYSLSTPLSTAFGKNIMHGVVGINKNSVTTGYVLDVLGNTNLDGNLNVVGDVDIDGGDLTASTTTFNLLNTSPTTTINFGGNATTIQIAKADATSTVNINGTTESTSCTTGALVVDGGVGIAKKLNVCGNVNMDATTESTSCTTGALVVDGGVGIAKKLNVCGDVNMDATTESTSCTTGALVVDGGVGIAKKLNVCGDVNMDATTESTSCTTGALVVDGGVGIAKRLNVCGDTNLGANLNVVGDVDIDGGDLTASTTTFNLLNTSPTTTINFGGNATTIQIGKVATNSTVNINGTTESTSCTTGALVVDGGVGISKNLNVCGNLTVNGEFTYLHTEVQVTSAMEITNTGTGPALKVTQSGTQPIAHFIDANGDDIVFNDNGFVGIGIATPTEKLTVNGRVSATGFRSNQGIPSNTNNSTNGYAFGSDGDTGLFSPIVGGGASNGVVSLFSNNVEKLRVDGTSIKTYTDLSVNGDISVIGGDITVDGTITTDPFEPITVPLTNTVYNVTQADHNKTILAGHPTNTISINLPTGLMAGTQVSVIRTGAGTVQFAQGTGTPTIYTTPTADFKKLAFQNSAASAYWTGDAWYLVGDLLS